MKTIYKFSVAIEEKQKIKTVEEKDGQTVTVEKEENVSVPVYFYIKRPSKLEREEGDIIRSAHLSYCIQKGILTEAMLQKTYANYGGVLSDEEHKYYADLLANLKTETANFALLNAETSDATEEQKKANFDRIIDIRKKIISFQSDQEQFFQNTAEAKARLKFIEYLTLTLTYFGRDGQEPKRFFEGDTYEDRIATLSKMEDSEDVMYLKVRDRLTLLYSVLVAADGNITQEEMSQIEKENFDE